MITIRQQANGALDRTALRFKFQTPEASEDSLIDFGCYMNARDTTRFQNRVLR